MVQILALLIFLVLWWLKKKQNLLQSTLTNFLSDFFFVKVEFGKKKQMGLLNI